MEWRASSVGEQAIMLYAALLRAVNVGGRAIAMAGLRDLVAELNFNNARTVLQSGNVVFEGEVVPTDELESLFELRTAKRFDIETDYYVRTPAQWKTMLARNPYIDEAESDPSHLVVIFFKTAPPKASVEALRAAIRGRERVHLDGKHLYAFYPDGIGESKLTAALISKTMESPGTGRNWNTLHKIGALLAPPKR